MNEDQRLSTGLKARYRLPRWEELPNLDLYMDQLLSYLNKQLFAYAEDEKPVLTSSMVNNYVKNSIVKPPVRKHYKTYHLAFLIVVVIMKRCFSLSEISEMIRIYSNIEDEKRRARDYNKFVSVLEDCLGDVFETGTCYKSYFENPTYEQALMTSVIRTLAYKIYTDVQLQEVRQKKSADQTDNPEA